MAIPERRRMELQLLAEKAVNGDVRAMVEVAEIYSGYDAYDEALPYYEMAASHGNRYALEQLAYIYLFGRRGVFVDVNKAMLYFEQAADKGSVKAMSELADIYLHGKYRVTRDLDKARHYYEKGADAGNEYAQYFLALFYQGREFFNNKIPGAQVDETKAFNLFQKGAEQNHKQSMYELGRCYRDGKGTVPDRVKAKEWFFKAIIKGDNKSLFGWAVMVVDQGLTDTEKQVIEHLIESRLLDDVRKEWFQWYSNKKVKSPGQEVNNNRSLVDDLDLANATFLLARLLASTLDQDNLRIANNLISKVEDQRDSHELLAWLSVLVEDLCTEAAELFHIALSREQVVDMQVNLRPIALIGQGQFGKVYLSWFQPRFDYGIYENSHPRYVAIKFVDINLAYEDKVLARNVVREQFTCRALMAKKVKHTVQYFGYTDLLQQRKRGLVFELCSDITKVKELAEEGRKISLNSPIDLDKVPNWIGRVPSSLRSCVVFPEGSSNWTMVQIITMLRKAAEALLEVHKLGFIHRDIAPRNILCDGEGNVQLADFGWAKFVGSSSRDDATQLAEYGKAFFTTGHCYALAWWAPECFGSEEEDEDAIFSWNSDVYAFGVTMWMCFSHKDPFSHLLDPERIKNMILAGERPSLIRKPDIGGVLDQSTPDGLIALIKSCWQQRATERVTLAGMIEVLTTIETNLQGCTRPHMGRKSHKKDVTQYWYDESTHKILNRVAQGPTTPSDGKLYGGEYSEAQEIKRLQRICHKHPTIDNIPSHVKNSLEETPYDVFLVHAGEQKMDTVETMKKMLEDGGLRCFLDRNMQAGTHPAESMKFALTTCRYAVVVLSREFFEKRHPASELMYAFKRMQWIRNQDCTRSWDSLYVVLYNVTVKQYEEVKQGDGIELPDTLCSKVVLVEWSGLGKIPWYVECLKLRETIVKQDNKNALDRWVQYLEQYGNRKLPNDFLSADVLYSDVRKSSGYGCTDGYKDSTG